MSSVIETIEHVTYEGANKVAYEVEIEYLDEEMAETLCILSVNGLDSNYISSAFLDVIKNEIIEDKEASNTNSGNPLDIEPSLLAPQI